MAKYYMNKNAQNNGDHEVHEDGCKRMPIESNKQYLGDFTNCHPAVAKAKESNPKADGCFYCSRDCNTS